MSSDFKELRAKAIEALSNKKVVDTGKWENDAVGLIEELSIHQIELEYQNEELIRSQAQVQKISDEYTDLFNNAPVGHLVVDKDHNIINVNSTLCKLLYCDKDDLIGNEIERYISPLFQDTFYHFFKLLSKGELVAQVDVKMRSPNRNNVYVRIDGTSEQGCNFFRFAIIDISLQKKLEERLRKETENVIKSEEKFRQIVERSSDVFCYIDIRNKTLSYISPRIFKMTGYTVDECLRMSNSHILSLILPIYRERYVNLVNRLLEAEVRYLNVVSDVFELMVKSGGSIWINASFSLVRDPSTGTPYQIFATLHDITKNKAHEQELLDAKLKAEQSDQYKSAFLADMSHEIRTPLNAIIGFANVMIDAFTEKDDQESLEYVSIVKKNGERLLELINDLVFISKIEAKRIEVKKTTFDLNQLLRDTYSIFRLSAEEKGLELKWSNNNTPLHITTDRGKLTSCVYNLIKNALKYTDTGTVEYEASVDKKNVLHFKVTDTGVGIPKDKIPSIFNRFSQLKQTGATDGVGLGLSIVQGIITLLHGEIKVESEVGKGSVFSFSIPM